MLLALMADIHSNREAFAACLAAARAEGARRIVFVGDYVGYGADPGWVVETVGNCVAEGALAIRGNHDQAIGTPDPHMNEVARQAIDWSRGELQPRHRKFLAELPMSAEDDRRLFVHASAARPERWPYVVDRDSASASLAACDAQVTFTGHVHVPSVYGITATGKLVQHAPKTGVKVPLPRHRRWHVVLGSVGQPRDRDPGASYALLDTAASELVFKRVPYDTDAAARKIRAAGLPEWLAQRLGEGR
jgi:diadenosine tetraphosphatase ApaH/serine/threonine PP2A family protein phosphatase